MSKFTRIVFLLLLPILLLSREYDYKDVMDRIKQTFENATQLYSDAKIDEAREVAQSAYFELFENLEGPIRINVSAKKSMDMEKKFTNIRNLIKKQAPLGEIQEMIDSLNADMDEVLPALESGVTIKAHSHDEGGSGSSLNIKWQTVFNNIDKKFQDAIEALREGDKKKTKEIIRSALVEDYGNSKAEVAIRQYLSKEKNGKIKNDFSRINIAVDNTDDPLVLQNELFRLKMSLFLALNELPPEAADIAQVKVDLADEEDVTSAKVDGYKVLEEIKVQSKEAIELYKKGKSKKAMMMMQDTYFDIFEQSGMEVRIGAIDSNLKTTIEGTFSRIVALMKQGSSAEDVNDALIELYSQITTGAEKLEGSSNPLSLFIFSLIIILREGLEALIVITAVIAYLVKSGNSNRLSIVYSSLWTAIGLSFVTAFILTYIIKASGEMQELLEGIVMLIAVGFLFYVGFWLLSNAHAKKWSHYISGKVKDSLSGGSVKALWFTVFLAVYREGAETVLFYQALIFDANDAMGYGLIGLGFIVGLIILVIIFFLLRKGAVKIPIKPFFLVTSTIILVMSVIFTGKGVMELVEGKIISPTLIEGAPTITWLGVYPYYESLVPQLILIVLIVFGTIFITNRAKKEALS